MKKLFVAILAVTLFTTAGFALAQGWGRGAGMGYGPGMGMGPSPYGPGYYLGAGMTALNLTQEQLQQMQTLREAHWRDIAPLQKELVTKQLELRSLWLQASPDQEKILAKQKEVNAIRGKIQEKATKYRLEMRQILTPEQQAKLGSLYGGFGAGSGFGRKGGFGPGRGMGYGPCFW